MDYNSFTDPKGMEGQLTDP